MAILPIRIYPDPVLREEALEQETFDQELEELVENMIETMYDANGVGLAAPQVGISKRILVLDVSDSRDQAQEFINPEILESEGSQVGEEGCLSIPEYREKVKRDEQIRVRALDRKGEEFEVAADELLSVCLQHEIDHLNGVLFIDHLSRLKRELFKRWWKKQEKAREA